MAWEDILKLAKPGDTTGVAGIFASEYVCDHCYKTINIKEAYVDIYGMPSCVHCSIQQWLPFKRCRRR